MQPVIPQVVPPEWCFKCDVCCRFPEKGSFLAPYFSREEIISATLSGLEKCFPSIHKIPPFEKGGVGGFNGSKITLIPYMEAYICPAFDPSSSHCKIYDARPLDCIIYPFAIMWSADRREILLGVDSKCPYVTEFINSDRLREAEIEMRNTIDSSPVLDILSENPGLIGPFQDDVAHAVVLTNLTRALT